MLGRFFWYDFNTEISNTATSHHKSQLSPYHNKNITSHQNCQVWYLLCFCFYSTTYCPAPYYNKTQMYPDSKPNFLHQNNWRKSALRTIALFKRQLTHTLNSPTRATVPLMQCLPNKTQFLSNRIQNIGIKTRFGKCHAYSSGMYVILVEIIQNLKAYHNWL